MNSSLYAMDVTILSVQRLFIHHLKEDLMVCIVLVGCDKMEIVYALSLVSYKHGACS